MVTTKYKPDFYLTSTEHADFKVTRTCQVKSKIKCAYAKENADGLWIQVDPPIAGQKYGLGDKNVCDLVIYARFEGTSLFPISEWPLHVCVFRVMNAEVLKTGRIEKNVDVELWTWAEIFQIGRST